MSQIQQKIIYYQAIDKLIDSFIILLSLLISIISENLYHSKQLLTYDDSSFSVVGVVMTGLITFFILLYIERFFIYRITTYRRLFFNILKVCSLTFSIVVFIDFMFKADLFFRSTIIFYTLFLFCFLFVKRVFFKIYLSNIRTQGRDIKNIIVIGLNSNTYKFIDNINEHKEFGFNVTSIVYEDRLDKKIPGYDYIHIDNIDNILLNESIDEVFVINIDNKSLTADILQNLEHIGINYHIVIDVDKFKAFDKSTISPVIDSLYNIPTISFYSANATYYKLVIKNFIETIIAFIILVCTIPIVLTSIVLIVFTSRGNPFFTQERVGLRNRKFNQYKLRTMFLDAESRKKDLIDRNEHDGPAFKLTNDPRITFIGKYLRKYSIDELPQLINVMKGEMNLIGPRPPIPDEVSNYKISYHRRFTFKPGITGLWQISGRNNIKNFDDWIKLDLQYIDNWSLKQDFIIALKTIPAILKGTGK